MEKLLRAVFIVAAVIILGVVVLLVVSYGSFSSLREGARGAERIPSIVTQTNADRSTEDVTSTDVTSTDVTPAPVNTEPVPDILLVNAAHPLPTDYSPGSLVNLYAQKGRHFQLAKADIEVEAAVFDAMEAMFTAAQKDGVEGFIITSGYRSREAQETIFAATTDGTAANPGESEHETGLAFDVVAMGDENFENTPQFEWLSEHCAEYGFILRYPEGMEDVTGYPYEPWHYRYVGAEHATAIMDADLTLEQYAAGE